MFDNYYLLLFIMKSREKKKRVGNLENMFVKKHEKVKSQLKVKHLAVASTSTYHITAQIWKRKAIKTNGFLLSGGFYSVLSPRVVEMPLFTFINMTLIKLIKQ